MHEKAQIVAERPVPLAPPTIFHEPWWLELACDGNYREVNVESGGRLIGRLPYLYKRVAGQTILGMPAMTHVLGPSILTLAGPASRVSKEIAVTAQLIGQLPKAAHVSFRLHGGTSNTLAFQVAGYANSVQFTLEINPAPSDTLWKQMRDKTRNSIRRAQERLDVIESTAIAGFLDFYEDNLRSRGTRNHYRRAITEGVIAQSLARGVGRILVCVDAAGHDQAAIFTVWDHRSEYYFMSTRALGCLNGAVSVLMWHALQHAAQKGLVFDMDGIHVVNEGMPNLLLLSGFGGSIVPRYSVRRTSATMELARSLSRWRLD